MSNKDKKGSTLKGFLLGTTITAVACGGLFCYSNVGYDFIAENVKEIPVLSSLFELTDDKKEKMEIDVLRDKLSNSELLLSSLTVERDELRKNKETLQAEVEKLRTYEEQYSEFESLKEAWSSNIATDNLDTFKQVFQEINPDTASSLYSDIMSNDKKDVDLKEYSSVIGEMDTSKSAKAIEKLVVTDSELVKDMFDSMNKEMQAAILSEMETKAAAVVMKLISPDIKLKVLED